MTFNTSIWPEAFSERIRKQFPETAGAFLNCLGQPPKVSVRINTKKLKSNTDTKQVPWSNTEQVPWCDTGFFLKERPIFALDPLWHAGAYYVQEASSMFLEKIVGTIKSDVPRLVLDLCAAPGGKSTHLNSLLNEEDLLVSNEVIRSRIPVLTENLTKWGYSNVLVTNSDARQFGEQGGLFDILVIDAPCSGEGLFRRDPGAAKEWSTENANLCAARQRRILADSWKCLKAGGYLIYSTCTFNPAENEENLTWFKSQANFISVKIPLVTEWNIDELEYEGIYGYRFLPCNVKGEGFFVSLLHKNEDAPPAIFPKKFITRLQKPVKFSTDWVHRPEMKKFFQHNDRLKFIPTYWEKEILYLFDNINVIKAGTTIGSLIKNDILPNHELAMSVEMKGDAFPCIELQREEALKYLRREQFSLEAGNGLWQLITSGQVPLGFIKNLNYRFNNYYPKEWRLRMTVNPGT